MTDGRCSQLHLYVIGPAHLSSSSSSASCGGEKAVSFSRIAISDYCNIPLPRFLCHVVLLLPLNVDSRIRLLFLCRCCCCLLTNCHWSFLFQHYTGRRKVVRKMTKAITCSESSQCDRQHIVAKLCSIDSPIKEEAKYQQNKRTLTASNEYVLVRRTVQLLHFGRQIASNS